MLNLKRSIVLLTLLFVSVMPLYGEDLFLVGLSRFIGDPAAPQTDSIVMLIDAAGKIKDTERIVNVASQSENAVNCEAQALVLAIAGFTELDIAAWFLCGVPPDDQKSVSGNFTLAVPTLLHVAIQVDGTTLEIGEQKRITIPKKLKASGAPFLQAYSSSSTSGNAGMSVAGDHLVLIGKTASPQKSILREAGINPTTGAIVAPFPKLLAPYFFAGAFVSSNGDIKGTAELGVGELLLSYKVRGQTGKLNLPVGSNFFGSSSMDFTPALGSATGQAGQIAQKRFAIYRVIKLANGAFTSTVLLQVLNASGATLTPAGPAKPLQPSVKTNVAVLETFQTVGIAPTGQFALYTQFTPSCGGLAAGKSVLKLQKLNTSTGAKVGKAVTLLGCNDLKDSLGGVHGLDVIQVQ